MEKIKKLGVQLHTVRHFMQTEKDIRETFKNLRALGYDQGQTANCAIPYEVFGEIAKEEVLEIIGTHDNFQMVCDDFETALKNHQALAQCIWVSATLTKILPLNTKNSKRKRT